MRVIAGKWRGKVIEAPAGDTTRPTSDRARESLFNILNSYLMKMGRNWDTISFADIFSGSGAMGIEALSRGACRVTCLEKDREALRILDKNTQNLKGIEVLKCDALFPPIHPHTDIVFMDAPYGKGLWQKALIACDKAGWISNETLIVIETDQKLKETLPEGYVMLQERSAGRNKFIFSKRSCEQ